MGSRLAPFFLGDSAANRPSLCPQCGDDWSALERGLPEFCAHCGSPTAPFGFNPFRAQVIGFGGLSTRVNRKAKTVLRLGVFFIGVLTVLSGTLLTYGSWFNPSDAHDFIQLWGARLVGPVFIVHGFIYSALPFRHPDLAKVLAFPKKRS